MYIGLVLLLVFGISNCSDTIYLIREERKDYDNNLFKFANESRRKCIWNSAWEPNMWLAAKRSLKKKSYDLKTPSTKDKKQLFKELYKAKWIVDHTNYLRFTRSLLGENKEHASLLSKMVIMLWEPPVVCPEIWSKALHWRVAKVLTWDDSVVDGKKYFLFRWPVYSGFKLDHLNTFSSKKLACFINGNKHSEHPKSLYQKRLDTVVFFNNEHPGDMDFYGTGWPKNKYGIYKGVIPADKKEDVMSRYRFCICYENMRDVFGYVTEKIFNAFESGCVPVYWGAKNITRFVPENCFIDRQKFSSDADLYRFLKNMNEGTYNTYIQNIINYLNTDLPYEFSPEKFAEYITACF